MRPKPEIDPATAANAVRRSFGRLRLLHIEQQALAAIDALTGLTTTIVGPAGTGRTAMLRIAIDAWRLMMRDVEHPCAILGLAPTRKAATIAADALGIRTATIHDVLHAESNACPLQDVRLIIVVEAELVTDAELDSLRAIAPESRIVIIDDRSRAGGHASNRDQPGWVHEFRHAVDTPERIPARLLGIGRMESGLAVIVEGTGPPGKTPCRQPDWCGCRTRPFSQFCFVDCNLPARPLTRNDPTDPGLIPEGNR